MKTPGAFAMSRAAAEITPSMMQEAQLKCQQGSQKASLQSIMKDQDLPHQLRTALKSMHQATAGLIGSTFVPMVFILDNSRGRVDVSDTLL
jgi:hypothetical protein